MQTTLRQIEALPTPSQARLYGVLSSHIDQIWKEVAPLLSQALEYSDGKYSLESIKQALINRDMQLWLSIDGHIEACGVTQIVSYPCKKVCNFMFVAGRDMEKWLTFENDIKQWAREHGCQSIELYGRPGWQKILPWERIHVVLREHL
jgi:transposase